MGNIVIKKECFICGNTLSDLKFSLTGIPKPKYFCSENCKKKSRANYDVLLGKFFMLFGIIGGLLSFIDFPVFTRWLIFSFLIILIGLLSFYEGKKNQKLPIKYSKQKSSDLSESVTQKFSELYLDEPEEEIYQKIKVSNDFDKSIERVKLAKNDYISTIYVKELGQNFSLCCYQAARFGEEKYCLCGRVLPIELREIFLI